MVHGQDGYRLRCDWGPSGAEAVAVGASIVAVVDVLSFTTTLTVAADAGVEVYPYRWRDDSAAEFARAHGAVLAVGRSVAGEGQVSLSPMTVRRAVGLRALVLPSPNGSTIAQAMAGEGRTVLGVSLRNARAAAAWTATRLGTDDAVAVIAGGERWRDGLLRPAVEDLWGAGAYLAALADHGVGPPSPEARTASAAYRDAVPDLPHLLRTSASGRELIASGYAADVDIAAELDASAVVPVLTGASFRHRPPAGQVPP